MAGRRVREARMRAAALDFLDEAIRAHSKKVNELGYPFSDIRIIETDNSHCIIAGRYGRHTFYLIIPELEVSLND